MHIPRGPGVRGHNRNAGKNYGIRRPMREGTIITAQRKLTELGELSHGCIS